MAGNKLFGYSIEESDGKLVITVDGVYAQKATEHLRAEMDAGRGWMVLSQLSPVGRLNRMARRASRREEESVVEDDLDPAELDLEKIFKQGFGDSYEGFSSQFDSYARALAQLKTEFDAGRGPLEESPATTKKPTKP